MTDRRPSIVHTDLSDAQAEKLTIAAQGAGVRISVVDSGGHQRHSAAWRLLYDGPDAVFVGLERGMETALEIVSAIDAADPTIPVVLATSIEETTWKTALRAGARDVIDLEDDGDELREVLARTLKRADARVQRLGDGDGDPAIGPGRTRIVTIAAPKGGSGKTMLATNLAMALQRRHPGRVLLLDLDLQFGDVSAALSIRPDYTISNAVATLDDPTTTRSFLSAHPSGLFVMTAPFNPAEADLIQAEQIADLLRVLGAEFDFVIVDTAAGIDDVTLAAIEQSTDLLLITTPDLSSIQAMRKAVLVLDQIGVTDHRRWYVLNRSNAKVGLDRDDIERSVGLSIDATLPSSRGVPSAMNQGLAVMEDDPRSPVARAIDSFAVQLSPTRNEPRTGWRGRIRA